MNARQKSLSVWHKATTIASLALGIGINLATAKSVFRALSYFTMQSNILCLIVFITFLVVQVEDRKKTDVYYIAKGGCTMAIFMTALIYNGGILFGGFELGSSTINIIRTVLTHMISPTLVILDYFLYEEKGKLKKSYPLMWLPFTAYYLIYANIYALFGEEFRNKGSSGNFAYFFLDYEKLGYLKVFGWIILIVAVFLIVAYGVVFFDSRGAKKESA